MSGSRFSSGHGILFAGDLDGEEALIRCLDEIHEEVAALKVGNALLYQSGVRIVERLKRRYGMPIVADLKLADIGHIAKRVARQYSDSGADAIVLTAICGPDVVGDVCAVLPRESEVWVFSEFTHDDGQLSVELADLTIRRAIAAGARGVQAPGTRPYRVEDVRSQVGPDIAVMACGIGVQGGRFGSAIRVGANFEIIGRSIYGAAAPWSVAREARNAIDFEVEKLQRQQSAAVR